jgi:hypothetical protein
LFRVIELRPRATRTPAVSGTAKERDATPVDPKRIIVATHMEALDHASVSRSDLRAAATAAGISNEQLLIPTDGEELVFDSR